MYQYCVSNWLVITLNINGQNTPTKRWIVIYMTKKKPTPIIFLQEADPKYKHTKRMKIKEWEKILRAHTNQRKVDQLFQCQIKPILR